MQQILRALCFFAEVTGRIIIIQYKCYRAKRVEKEHVATRYCKVFLESSSRKTVGFFDLQVR